MTTTKGVTALEDEFEDYIEPAYEYEKRATEWVAAAQAKLDEALAAEAGLTEQVDELRARQSRGLLAKGVLIKKQRELAARMEARLQAEAGVRLAEREVAEERVARQDAIDRRSWRRRDEEKAARRTLNRRVQHALDRFEAELAEIDEAIRELNREYHATGTGTMPYANTTLGRPIWFMRTTTFREV